MPDTRTDETGAKSDSGGKGWRRLMPVLAVAVVGLVGFLLYRTLGNYDFDEVVASVMSVSGMHLALAIAFAGASYLTLTLFDYMALRYAGHPLAYPRAAVASFSSLSIGHNVGLAALSSGAIRYRFYSRWGLGAADVAKVILFCGLTVGLGLIILAGIALTLQPGLGAEITGLRQGLVVALGLACLAVPAVYLALAATVRKPLRWQDNTLEMPPLKLALGQVVVGPVNFAFVAAALHQAVSALADIPYLAVASVYVLANVATLITHVPGGLGVIESVVLFLLPQADLIGAVLVFRFVYFLLPLALGAMTLGASELFLARRSARGQAEEAA